MTPQRAFLVQTLLEALIPVIGYFSWGWDLSFILLFYLLDWILATAITAAKGLKRQRYFNGPAEKRTLVKALTAAVLLMATGCFLTGAALTQLQPGLSWTERILAFLAYDDMGIAQGYLLVPLLALNGLMIYRQQFLLTARYRTQTMETITRPLVKQGIVLLACSGLLLGLVPLVAVPQEVLIAVAVVGISVYRWVVLRAQ